MKSQLKKLIKERINGKMMRMVNKAKSMKKLRFIKTDLKFTRKRYIIDMEGEEAYKP